MEKFKQACQAMAEALEDYAIQIRNPSWMTMEPSIEQRSELAKGAWASETYSQEAYDVIATKLHDTGFTLDYKNDNDSDNYNTRVWSAGLPYKLMFRVEKDTADECAKLKARLAELGCHY